MGLGQYNFSCLMWWLSDVMVVWCDGCLMWWLSDVVVVWCNGCLKWWLSDVVVIWCDGCLMWWLSDVMVVWCDGCLQQNIFYYYNKIHYTQHNYLLNQNAVVTGNIELITINSTLNDYILKPLWSLWQQWLSEWLM